MNTFVEFCSLKFPANEGEEENINPGVWGERLADYLIEKLQLLGIEVDEHIAEDWGYYIPVKIDNRNLALCCGHQYGDADVCICFTEPKKPIYKKWFKTIDVTPQLERLTQALNEILTADPDITNIQWSEAQ